MPSLSVDELILFALPSRLPACVRARIGQVPEVQGPGGEIPHQAVVHLEHAAHPASGLCVEPLHDQPASERPLLQQHPGECYDNKAWLAVRRSFDR